MHSTSPTPHTAMEEIHLIGGPLDGATIEAPVHSSQMTFDTDATYGDGTHNVPIAGETYYYSAYLSTDRPTFRHTSLPWDYGSK